MWRYLMHTSTSGQVNNIEEALTFFGVSETILSQQEKHDLDHKGYLIFPTLLNKSG